MDAFFLPGAPPITSDAIRKKIDAEAEKHGPFGLVIVDTSAAYFQGDDENPQEDLVPIAGDAKRPMSNARRKVAGSTEG